MRSVERGQGRGRANLEMLGGCRKARKKNAAKTILDFLGFPWFFLSESSLFSGLREVFTQGIVGAGPNPSAILIGSPAASPSAKLHMVALARVPTDEDLVDATRS